MARFVVIRVNGDLSDAYAVELGGPETGSAIGRRNNAVNRAIEISGAQPGELIQWALVSADDAGAARLADWPRGPEGILTIAIEQVEEEPTLEEPVRFPFLASALLVTPERHPEFWERGKHYGPHYQFHVAAETRNLLDAPGRERQSERGFFVRFVVPDRYPKDAGMTAADMREYGCLGASKYDAAAIVQWAHEYEQFHARGSGKPPLSRRDIEALAAAFPDTFMERIAKDGDRLLADVSRARQARNGWVY